MCKIAERDRKTVFVEHSLHCSRIGLEFILSFPTRERKVGPLGPKAGQIFRIDDMTPRSPVVVVIVGHVGGWLTHFKVEVENTQTVAHIRFVR